MSSLLTSLSPDKSQANRRNSKHDQSNKQRERRRGNSEPVRKRSIEAKVRRESIRIAEDVNPTPDPSSKKVRWEE